MRRTAAFWIGVLVLLELIALTIHWPIRHGYFQVEDFLWLRLSEAGRLRDAFTGTWGHGVAYRPVMRLSYYLDWLAFGRNPEGWHLENVVLFALDGALLGLVVEKLRGGRAMAVAAAFLFVTSPLGGENTDWISGRTGLLTAFFGLVAVLAFVHRARGGRGLVVCIAACWMALATYEAALALPIVLALTAPILVVHFGASRRRIASDLAVIVAAAGAFWILRWRLLGMWGAVLDKPHDSLGAALRQNIPSALGLFSSCWGWLQTAITAAAIALGLARRETRLITAMLIAMAVVLYAPFVMVDGVGPRFLFLGTAPLAVASALPATLVADPRLRRGCAAVLVALTVPGFASSSRANALGSRSAGTEVHAVLDEVRTIMKQDSRSNLLFACVPQGWNGWPMLGDALDLAIGVFENRGDRWVTGQEWTRGRPDVLAKLRATPTRIFRFSPPSVFAEVLPTPDPAAEIRCVGRSQ